METPIIGKHKTITIDGETTTLYELAKKYGVHYQTIEYRIKHGWDRKAWFLPAPGAGRGAKTKEQRQRGCFYCLDFVDMACKHKECPYHELDGFKTYEEYLKKSQKNGLVKMLEELG